MKPTTLTLCAALALSACAASIPETTRYDGESMIMQIKSDSEKWFLTIDGEIVATNPIWQMSAENTLRGSYKGKPVVVNMYYRGNGFTSRYVGDVYIGGEMVEMLVVN